MNTSLYYFLIFLHKYHISNTDILLLIYFLFFLSYVIPYYYGIVIIILCHGINVEHSIVNAFQESCLGTVGNSEHAKDI